MEERHISEHTMLRNVRFKKKIIPSAGDVALMLPLKEATPLRAPVSFQMIDICLMIIFPMTAVYQTRFYNVPCFRLASITFHVFVHVVYIALRNGRIEHS